MKNVKQNVLKPVKNVVVEEPLVNNAVPTDEKNSEGSHEELSNVLNDAGISSANDLIINDEKATKAEAIEAKAYSLSYEEAPELSDEQIANLKRHPLNFMRGMSDKEYNALTASFEKGYDGESFKTTLAPDEDDNNELKIADGYHSWKACMDLKLKPSFRVFRGTSEQILLHVLRAGTRRNLSPRDAALLVIIYEKKYAEILEKEALKRKSDGGKMKGNEDSPEMDNLKKPKKGRTDDLIAELLGVNASKTTIGKLKKIIRESEDKDLLNKLIRNEITVDEVMSTKKPKGKGGRKAPVKPKEKDVDHEDDGDEDEEHKDGDTDDVEHNYFNVPTAKPDNTKPLKPVLTEKYVNDKVTEGLPKLIALQTDKRVIEEKIQNLGAGDTTVLNGERSSKLYDIYRMCFELGYLLYFGKKYDDTMSNFDEMATL